MKKIMFNDKYGLTKAVLEGRKTMTRRVVSEKILEAYYDYDDYVCAVAPRDIPCSREYEQEFFLRRSPFKVGDVVAVAQSYHSLNKSGYVAPEWLDHYCEDSAGYENKMFVRADLMPNQIRITNVRVERLQDISDEDCAREGIYKDNPRPGFYFNGYAFEVSKDQHGDVLAARWFKTPREAFAALIDKVSGKGTWASNPWVYAYEFELVKED